MLLSGADCGKTSGRGKGSEAKEETAVYPSDSYLACLFFLWRNRGLIWTVQKSFPQLLHLRKSLRDAHATKELRPLYAQYSDPSSALLSEYFRPCMRILRYSIQTGYTRSSLVITNE